MNKSQLVDRIAEAAAISKDQAKKAIDGYHDAVTDTLKEGGEIVLPGYGKFYLRERAARTGRNPRTGEEMQIAASRTAAFKPGSTLKSL